MVSTDMKLGVNPLERL